MPKIPQQGFEENTLVEGYTMDDVAYNCLLSLRCPSIVHRQNTYLWYADLGTTEMGKFSVPHEPLEVKALLARACPVSFTMTSLEYESTLVCTQIGLNDPCVCLIMKTSIYKLI